MKKRSEQGTRNHQQIIFRKVWTIHTQNSDQRWIFEYSDEIEVSLPFHWSFSTFWNISGDLCNHVFYSWRKSDLKSEVICFQNRYVNNISNHTQNSIARNFENLIMKRLLRTIHGNKKTWNCKVPLGLICAFPNSTTTLSKILD